MVWSATPKVRCLSILVCGTIKIPPSKALGLSLEIVSSPLDRLHPIIGLFQTTRQLVYRLIGWHSDLFFIHNHQNSGNKIDLLISLKVALTQGLVSIVADATKVERFRIEIHKIFRITMYFTY